MKAKISVAIDQEHLDGLNELVQHGQELLQRSGDLWGELGARLVQGILVNYCHGQL